MARKRNIEDSGRLLTPEEASYLAAHDYGTERLCQQHQWRHSTFLKQLDPKQSGHQLRFEQYLKILQDTRDERLLTSVLATVGAVWLWKKDIEEPAGDLDLLDLGNGLLMSSTGMVNEVVRSLDDNEIDQEEMGRILKHAYGVFQHVHGLTEVSKQYQSEDVAEIETPHRAG